MQDVPSLTFPTDSRVRDDPRAVPPRSAGVILACTTGALVCITPTVMATLGMFLVPISIEFGWSRSAVAGALGVVALANAAMSPIAGRLADRIGPRKVILFGNVMLALTVAAISLAPPVHAIFYLLYAATGVAGALSSTMVISKLLAEWFDNRRGLWIGFCGGIGNSLGSVLFPLLGAAVLASHGWRGGYALIGVVIFLAGFPILATFLKEAPTRNVAKEATMPSHQTGIAAREALRSPLFWLLFSNVPLGIGFMTALFPTIVPLLSDRGFSISQAVSVTVAFALTTAIVEPATGMLLDRTPRPRALAPLYLCSCVGLWLLLTASGESQLLFAGMLCGIGAGAHFSVLPFLLSRYFGLRELGTISGVAFGGGLVFGAVAPVILNLCFDFLGSYAPAIYGIAAIMAYCAITIVVFPTYRYMARP